MTEELVLCGFKHLEVTNFGNPRGMPQFKDADNLFKAIRKSKRIKDKIDGVQFTAITIRERSIERAIQAKLDGYGPDRILLMVSTSESHQKKNSGLSIDEYWKMSEEWIPKAQAAGIKGALVRTGKFRPEDLDGEIQPDLVIDCLAALKLD